MDLALHIGKLAKEVEFRGQSHKAIFSSKPYSYWKAKVRRTYFDGARQIQLLEEWEKKWTSAAIGFDAVTGAWALVPELREERLRSIKALCAANRLTDPSLPMYHKISDAPTYRSFRGTSKTESVNSELNRACAGATTSASHQSRKVL